MLAIVKHVVDANYVFQQLSGPAHGACNTGQLLHCKTQRQYQSYMTPAAQGCIQMITLRDLCSNVNGLLVANQQHYG